MKHLVNYLAFTMVCTMTATGVAQEQAQPGKEHELLQQDVGEFTGQMKIWLAPGAEPLEIPFQETSKSILGGFWVETQFTAGPYHGRGITGYDPKKKKYIGTWASNVTPHLSVMEGTYDEATRTVTMLFQDYDQQTGKLTDMKSERTTGEKGTRMTMFRKADGKWQKSFELIYADARK